VEDKANQKSDPEKIEVEEGFDFTDLEPDVFVYKIKSEDGKQVQKIKLHLERCILQLNTSMPTLFAPTGAMIKGPDGKEIPENGWHAVINAIQNGTKKPENLPSLLEAIIKFKQVLHIPDYIGDIGSMKIIKAILTVAVGRVKLKKDMLGSQGSCTTTPEASSSDQSK